MMARPPSGKSPSKPELATTFELSLPPWLIERMPKLPKSFATIEQRMELVIELSRQNFKHDTGGPFAAAVFNGDTGELLSLGVNRVTALMVSSVHAEVVALTLAQARMGNYDLGAPGMPTCQLVSSSQPCVLCFGATLWSGVRSLVVGCDGKEVEAVTGFDEGPLHPHWQQELASRGIALETGVLQRQALQVLEEFKSCGGTVYNARKAKRR